MLSFFKKHFELKDMHEHGEMMLSLDIGTEYVKALVCEVTGTSGVVRGVGKQSQRLGDMNRGGIIDIEGVLANAEEAILEAERMAGVETDQLVIGIAGEYVKGATTTVEYKRESPSQKISMAELKNIVHKIQWKAFERVRKQLSWESGYQEMDIKLVHAAIVDVRIDGYKVSNPLGFKGKYITISVFNAFAPLVHYDSLYSIARELDKDLLAIVVEPYAVSRCLGYEDGSDFSAIFVDIGGGTTDVAVVQNGGIVGTRMFAIGGRVFTKRISKRMNLSFKEAEKMKIAYSHGELEDKELGEVKAILKNDADVWLSGLQLALEDFEEVEVLPSKILLCGGGASLPIIKDVLNKGRWYQDLHFARKPFASYIKPSDIYNVEDGTKQLSSLQDITPMALANTGLQLAGKDDILPRILGQVTRMMRR